MYEQRHFRQFYDVFVHKLQVYCDVVYFSVQSIVTEPCIYQNLNTSGCHGCLCFLQHPILELVINVYNKLTHITKETYLTQTSSLTFL